MDWIMALRRPADGRGRVSETPSRKRSLLASAALARAKYACSASAPRGCCVLHIYLGTAGDGRDILRAVQQQGCSARLCTRSQAQSQWQAEQSRNGRRGLCTPNLAFHSPTHRLENQRIQPHRPCSRPSTPLSLTLPELLAYPRAS